MKKLYELNTAAEREKILRRHCGGHFPTVFARLSVHTERPGNAYSDVGKV